MSERLYTEEEVDELRRASALEARVDEIQRFAQAGVEQQFRSVGAIQAYFMGRAVMLAMDIFNAQQEDDGGSNEG
jgi:hypothetical protein